MWKRCGYGQFPLSSASPRVSQCLIFIMNHLSLSNWSFCHPRRCIILPGVELTIDIKFTYVSFSGERFATDELWIGIAASFSGDISFFGADSPFLLGYEVRYFCAWLLRSGVSSRFFISALVRVAANSLWTYLGPGVLLFRGCLFSVIILVAV